MARRRDQVTDTQVSALAGQEQYNSEEEANQDFTTTQGSSESISHRLGSTKCVYDPIDQKLEHSSISVERVQVIHELVRRPEYLGIWNVRLSIFDVRLPITHTVISVTSVIDGGSCVT